MIVLWVPIIAGYRSCRRQAENMAVAEAARPPPPWKGPGVWVDAFKKIVVNATSVPVFGKTKDGDADMFTYDFAKMMPHGVGTLTRIRGKPGAWRWQVSGQGVQADDLVPASSMERLVAFAGDNTWFRIKAGDFTGHLVSFRGPGKESPMLTIETMAYSENDISDGIRPWLCSNGKVDGLHALDSLSFEVKCERIVREHLKAPSTAIFKQLAENPETYSANCDMELRSWVEAKNPLGVPIRNAFACAFSARTGEVTAKFIR
jgi:hypothetical protein